MNSNQTKQIGNYANGNIAGRDNNTVTNYYNGPNISAYIQSLYTKFLEEERNDSEYEIFVEELDYYNSPFANDVIGLDAKLTDGNRENAIWYAREVKEKFHRKLIKTSQFSESCQYINAHLLAKVRSCYMLSVYPSVCNGEPDVYINSLIIEYIIKPIFLELGENLLRFNDDEIQGMLYFLTGNCHIKWTK